MVVFVGGAERVTVKSNVTVSPGSPSTATAVAVMSAVMLSSSLRIVPVPTALPITAFCGLNSPTLKVSSPSTSRSSITWIEMVRLVSPAAKESDALETRT